MRQPKDAKSADATLNIDKTPNAVSRVLDGEKHASKLKMQFQSTIASTKFSHIVPRVSYPSGQVFSNLYYEGNNISIRGSLADSGVYKLSGEEIQERWQRVIKDVRGVFVLRDSLFSQQEHPMKQRQISPMLPPNYITAAINTFRKGETIVPVWAPDTLDSERWVDIKSSDEMFGTFPRSQTLWATAKKSLMGTAKDEITLNARHVISFLATATSQLKKASKSGEELKIATTGASIISEGDIRYFGKSSRKFNVIPIFVENPSDVEKMEGKGFVAVNSEFGDSDIGFFVMKHVCAHRLRDGDIALERYDLSSAPDRNRILKILAAIAPSAANSKHFIWIWVTGHLDPDKKLQGESATSHFSSFMENVRKTEIDLSFVRFLSKPDVKLTGVADKSPTSILITEAKRHKALDLYAGVNVMSSVFYRMVEKSVLSPLN